MTTKSHNDAHDEPIHNDTERILRSFVRDAVSRLSEVLKDSVQDWEEETKWECGTDGHFRERRKRFRTLWPILNDEWLSSLADYLPCVEQLKSDVVIGPHLDRLVGTSGSAARMEASNIPSSMIYAMLNDDGLLAFTDERFDVEWRKWANLFGADRVAFKMVAPLPYLAVPMFLLRLNNQLVIDRLTDEEVTRCCQVGVIRPDSLRFPLIQSDVAVGIRRTTRLPKLIQQGDEAREPPAVGDEGTFGSRSRFRDDLVIDDVLSALRLFKQTHIRSAGHASWTDTAWLKGGTSYQVLRQWPYSGKFELSEDEVRKFLALWRVLEEAAALFGFSIHRFNLAFDRGLLADRIVDLVIAADSLFLGDLDVQDRGELRFRFALRAAKFIEHPYYGDHDIFRVMRRAYDARSAIVHGGSPKDTRLSDNQAVSLPTFIDAIEDLVRLGLRKALSMKEDGKKLCQAEYWETLILSNRKP